MSDENKPIKVPQQSRSRLAFDAILEACYRLLPLYGTRRTTTNKIAQTAGVSIGSLYQYFPNKEAIFASLIVRLQDEQTEEFLGLLKSSREHEPEEFIRLLVDKGLDIFLSNEQLFKSLFKIGPKVVGMETINNARESIVGSISDSFALHYHDIDPKVIEQTCWVIVQAFFGNLQAYFISERPPAGDDLKMQFNRLAIGYIRYALALERGQQSL